MSSLAQSDFRTRSVLVSSRIGFERTPRQLYFAVFTLVRCQMYPIRDYFVHSAHNGCMKQPIYSPFTLFQYQTNTEPCREESLVKGKAGSK